MSTKIVYLQGPVKWAKVFEGNRDKGKYAPADGQYTIDIGLNKEDTKEVKSWNRMYVGKVYSKLDKNYEPGDSKLTYFCFKRKHKHFKKDGESVIHEWSGEPQVVDQEGHDWISEDGDVHLIGNGSVCTLRLDVTTVDGNMTFVRLDGIRVDDHVEYVPNDDDGEAREPATEDNRTQGLPF